MKNEKGEKSFLVTLTHENFSSHGRRGYITGTDIVSDVCYCLDLWTWEDVMNDNLDYLDNIKRDTIKAFDWAVNLRDRKNADATLNALDCVKRSEYLAGDHFMLNTPGVFEAEWMNEMRKAEEYLEDNGFWEEDAADYVPAALIKELRDNETWHVDNLRCEWLKGDRSSSGVLGEISKTLTGEARNVTLDAEKDELQILFTEDQGRDFMGYALDETEVLGERDLENSVIEWLLSKAEAETAKREAKRLERVQDFQNRKEQEAKSLEAQKEAARERKRKQQAGQ